MVMSTFILTCAFAISALFVGALSPVVYAAPILTEATIPSSFLERRSCNKMGCLYALPDADSSNDGNTTTIVTASPSVDVSSSALQVIDILISAMQSAASGLKSSATIPAVNTTVLATETSADAQDHAPAVEIIDLST